jgi:hypothetical protein
MPMSSAAKKVHTLDVRPLLAAGGQPFGKIMKSIAGLQPGERLLLLTPFLPSPLIEKLQSEGFSVLPGRRSDGSWETQFWRE